MLLGEDVHVFTDHKNLTFDTLKTQCMLNWRTKIEEFSPMSYYIEGPCNVLANKFHRSIAKSLRLRSWRGRNS
jgi:hypothetical protein